MDIYFDRIKPLFDESGMKPKDIASAIGCSVRDVYHWNKDGYKTYEKYLYQIAVFFHVSVEYLKGETDEKNPALVDGIEAEYAKIIRDLCGDNLESLRQVQDALAKEPEKTKAKFDLFLKTL